jgi:cytidyltransferase-like protein
MVGSFDPIHRGHQRMIAELRRRRDRVLLLVPTLHLEKQVRFPENATLPQRVEMIRRVYPAGGVEARTTDDVLFVRLAQQHPEALFGVGRDTLEKLLRSRSYFERLGLGWTHEEERALARLRSRVVVFDRRELPISSTEIRRLAGELHAKGARDAEWRRCLGPLVAPPIISYVRENGLYRAAINIRKKVPLPR